MSPNPVPSASSDPTDLSVMEPKNADAVIQALGNLAAAQERDMPEHKLAQLRAKVIEAAGPDGEQLANAA